MSSGTEDERASTGSLKNAPKNKSKYKDKRIKKHEDSFQRESAVGTEMSDYSSPSAEKLKKRRKEKKTEKKSGKISRNLKNVKMKKKSSKHERHSKKKKDRYGKYGILRASNMWSKQTEFYAWMQEIKNINPDVVSKQDQKSVWEEFMECYNTTTLPHKKYYDLEKWTLKQIKKNEELRSGSLAYSLIDDPFNFNDEAVLRAQKRLQKSESKLKMNRSELIDMARVIKERREEDYKRKLGMKTDEARGVRYSHYQ